MEFSMLPQLLGLLKLKLKSFCTSNIEGRELCGLDFIENMFNIVMYQDMCKWIVSNLVLC